MTKRKAKKALDKIEQSARNILAMTSQGDVQAQATEIEREVRDLKKWVKKLPDEVDA